MLSPGYSRAEMHPTTRRRARKAGARVASGLITAALVAGLTTHLGLAAYTAATGTESYRVLSGSMEPAHATGTTLLVDRGVDRLEVQEGQVATFLTATGAAPTTHRVVERVHDDADQLWYRTQGDANPGPDRDLLHPANVIGVVHSDLDHALALPVVEAAVPLGQWVGFARTPAGIAVLFGPAIAALVLSELRIAIGAGRRRASKKAIRKNPPREAAQSEAPVQDGNQDAHEPGNTAVPDRTLTTADLPPGFAPGAHHDHPAHVSPVDPAPEPENRQTPHRTEHFSWN